MLASQVIETKRDGGTLSDPEITSFIKGFCDGEIADYQMSAFAMAICIRGMNADETASLTQAMLSSGGRLPRGDRPRVDKHSTGGLGDKVSLVLAPLLAAVGFDVPMISGRGLGITGGTLDKLESIPGLSVNFSKQDSLRILKKVGCFIVGADDSIAPADRRIYALRDVTGTVPSVPLITSSILSKKLAANLDALVMDIKCGEAAFMRTLEQARELTRMIQAVGKRQGLKIAAWLTDMDQPLGEAVGNALEVIEAETILRSDELNARQQRVLELSVELAASVANTSESLPEPAKQGQSLQAWREALRGAIEDGSAWERWEEMIRLQGGTPGCALSLAPEFVVTTPRSGWVKRIDAKRLGSIVLQWGGGRRRADDTVDHGVGLRMEVQCGDALDTGQVLARGYCRSSDPMHYAEQIRGCFHLVDQPVSPRPLVLESLDA